jgi:hypothetical protein
MVYCHLFVLLLLGVDWLEYPYFGRSPLSRPMASQPCIAHQEFQQQDLSVDENLTLHDQPLLLSSVALTPVDVSVTPVVSRLFCIPSLYFFMSLQR